MNITISGPAGSGKTTIAEVIAKNHGLEHVYAGRMIREMAAKAGKTIYEFNTFIDTHPEIDREVDETIVRKAQEGNKVLEGRLTGWMLYTHDIPALKIYFTIDDRVAAERVASRDKISMEDALEKNSSREHEHWQRFKKLYDLNKDDLSIYDQIIDTSDKTVEEIVAEVEAAITGYIQKQV